MFKRRSSVLSKVTNLLLALVWDPVVVVRTRNREAAVIKNGRLLADLVVAINDPTVYHTHNVKLIIKGLLSSGKFYKINM